MSNTEAGNVVAQIQHPDGERGTPFRARAPRMKPVFVSRFRVFQLQLDDVSPDSGTVTISRRRDLYIPPLLDDDGEVLFPGEYRDYVVARSYRVNSHRFRQLVEASRGIGGRP